MRLLNVSEEGFSLIETLVGIIILGLIVTISISVYVSLFSNPKTLLRNEAFNLANQEIEYIKNYKPGSDTVYFNMKKNLEIKREIEKEENYNTANVTVIHTAKKNKILELSVSFTK